MEAWKPFRTWKDRTMDERDKLPPGEENFVRERPAGGRAPPPPPPGGVSTRLRRSRGFCAPGRCGGGHPPPPPPREAPHAPPPTSPRTKFSSPGGSLSRSSM